MLLLSGSWLGYSRDKTPGALLQLLGAVSFAGVVFAHVCEALQLFPGMKWGEDGSVGHYLDLAFAVIGVTAFPLGYLLAATERGKRDG